MAPEKVLEVAELVMRQVKNTGNCAWVRIPPLLFFWGFVSIYNISWFLTPLSKLLNLHSR